jgi:integration host factor subunit alpha
MSYEAPHLLSAQAAALKSAPEPHATDDAQNTCTRASLARSLQGAVGASKAEASEYVAQFFAELMECIVSGDEAKLATFGSFVVREKREREGRNPKTGAAARIKARRVVVFRPSQVLRARIELGPRWKELEEATPSESSGDS